MEDSYRHLLTQDDQDDRLPQPSNKELKWHNQTAWQRKVLVDNGILQRPWEAGYGVWALTEEGWNVYRAMQR